MEISTKLVGRVTRVIERGRGAYFFIVTDDRKTYFSHQNDVECHELPSINALVKFVPLPVTAAYKTDRAVNVEIVSAPG